jgi:Fic family protein
LSETDKGTLLYLVYYIREVWVSELDPKDLSTVETEEAALAVVEGSERPANVKETDFKHLKNIYEAMKFLGIDNSSSESNIQFTVDTIKNVHQIVACDAVPNAGSFRLSEAGPAGYSIIYLPPKFIPSRLGILVKFVKDQLKHHTVMSTKVIEIISLFFSEFLKIHPFSDGNGRTARLLVNYLLNPFTIVPISIYITTDRSVYLDALVSIVATRR